VDLHLVRSSSLAKEMFGDRMWGTRIWFSGSCGKSGRHETGKTTKTGKFLERKGRKQRPRDRTRKNQKRILKKQTVRVLSGGGSLRKKERKSTYSIYIRRLGT